MLNQEHLQVSGPKLLNYKNLQVSGPKLLNYKNLQVSGPKLENQLMWGYQLVSGMSNYVQKLALYARSSKPVLSEILTCFLCLIRNK